MDTPPAPVPGGSVVGGINDVNQQVVIRQCREREGLSIADQKLFLCCDISMVYTAPGAVLIVAQLWWGIGKLN